LDSLKLKSARVGKGLTQKEMARLINLALPTYCNKENGKADFTVEEISKVTRVLDLSYPQIDEIFFDGKLTTRLSQEHAATSELKQSA